MDPSPNGGTMKKILAFLTVLALGIPAFAHADFNTNTQYGPFVGKFGGVLGGTGADASAIVIGSGSTTGLGCSNAFWANAVVNVVPGDNLVFVATGVSKTTTTADPATAGVAVTTALASSNVAVCTQGVVKCILGNTVAIGGKVISSGTAGVVTPVAAATETNFTGLSNTAIIGRALQAVTFSGVTKSVNVLLSK